MTKNEGFNLYSTLIPVNKVSKTDLKDTFIKMSKNPANHEVLLFLILEHYRQSEKTKLNVTDLPYEISRNNDKFTILVNKIPKKALEIIASYEKYAK